MNNKTIDLRTTESIKKTKSRRRWFVQKPTARIAVWLALGLAVFGLIGVGVYYQRNRSRSALTGDAQQKRVITQVSRHLLLPSNEEPALATVTDPSKLSTPFLKSAKTGDQVLIYQTNKLVIVYRPSVDRIVNVGPVTIDTPPSLGK